jgi:ubiquinone/menaquinone biosynthesis C-methylase UbiE
MKDNFSKESHQYSQFRPKYQTELFNFLESLIVQKESAWDCGSGNGQVAGELAKFFKKVEATDISAQQLDNAVKVSNINYSLQPAENTNFPDYSFDLITVAQAIHWFDFSQFYKEVNRKLKPGGIIAVIGYGLFKSNEQTNDLINHFYRDILGPYWDPERRFLDDGYRSIPFPFEEIQPPELEMEFSWDFEHLIGYLKTWSAVKHFQNKEGYDPVDAISGDLRTVFGERSVVKFPLLLRVGRKNIQATTHK